MHCTTKQVPVIFEFKTSKLLEILQIQICMATNDDCKVAQANASWLGQSLPGLRMRGETWYPIKIDGVYMHQVTKENENSDSYDFKDDILGMFSRDNVTEVIEVRAMKIAWLSKRSNRCYGSLLIWLSQKAAVDHHQEQYIVRFRRTIAQPSAYTPRVRPERYYKCNQYGHCHFRYKGNITCGICAGKYFTNDCKDHDNLRCAACQGPHTAMDRGCPVYQRQ